MPMLVQRDKGKGSSSLGATATCATSHTPTVVRIACTPIAMTAYSR
jgi:hypothetical protein